MDKVANRAFRRALKLFAGKQLPRYADPDIFRPIQQDLSKPWWERRGFDSMEDMLDAYRRTKRELGYLPLGGDGARELSNIDVSITGNLRSYLNRLLGRGADVPEAPALTPRQLRARKREVYNKFNESYKPINSKPSYTDEVAQYVKRGLKNHRDRLDALSRRHQFLHFGKSTSPFRGTLNSPDGLSLSPHSIAYGYEGYTHRGYDARMPRLRMKLNHVGMQGALGPIHERESIMDALSHALPAAHLPSSGMPSMPVLVTFKAKGPFGSTNHVADANITLSRMAEVDKAVAKLKSEGKALTADNISAEVYKTLDPSELRVHAGNAYTPEDIQAMRGGFFGDRVNTNYESTFNIGDPNYPTPIKYHVGGSAALHRRAEAAGLSDIFNRKPLSTGDMIIPDNDMILNKGTNMSVPSLNWKTPLSDEHTAADRISSAYNDALQSHLDAYFKRPSRIAGDRAHDAYATNSTVLGTVLDLPGAKKYPVGETTWLTPNPVTAGGYGQGTEFFPVTAEELRKLFDPDAAALIDPSEVLNALPEAKQKYIADLVARYGGYSNTEKFLNTVNKNIAQMNAMAPRIARSLPRGVITALLEGKDSKSLPEFISIYNPVNYLPAKEILRRALKRSTK